MIHFVILGVCVLIVILQVWILFVALHVKKCRANEYYTDYRYNNLVMRVYKHEFEYQAIGAIHRDKLLDMGNLTQHFMWALIED